MARRPVTEDDLERAPQTPEAHAQYASQLESWARAPHPNDEVLQADLLVAAGDHWSYAGDHDRALACFIEAVETGEPMAPDARAYLLQGLYDAGHDEEAERLLEALRAERPRDPRLYVLVGETLELRGDLPRATRWFTTGLLRAERDEAVADVDVDLLMLARARVRAAQGFDLDEYDELAADIRADAAHHRHG